MGAVLLGTPILMSDVTTRAEMDSAGESPEMGMPESLSLESVGRGSRNQKAYDLNKIESRHDSDSRHFIIKN